MRGRWGRHTNLRGIRCPRIIGANILVDEMEEQTGLCIGGIEIKSIQTVKTHTHCCQESKASTPHLFLKLCPYPANMQQAFIYAGPLPLQNE